MANAAVERMRQALGADAALPVHAQPHGPFGLEWLAQELSARQQPKETPTDQEVRRPVSFRRATWRALDALARQVSTPQHPVSAVDVAAVLLEREVTRLSGTGAHDASQSA